MAIAWEDMNERLDMFAICHLSNLANRALFQCYDGSGGGEGFCNIRFYEDIGHCRSYTLVITFDDVDEDSEIKLTTSDDIQEAVKLEIKTLKLLGNI